MRIVYVGEELFRYGFPPPHPLTSRRYIPFIRAVEALMGKEGVVFRRPPRRGEEVLLRFHRREYVETVREASERGYGLLDRGDTPAYKGVFEVALESVYATLDGVLSTLDGGVAVNIAGGWHHAFPDRASGFCIFNDIGVAIESIRDRVDRVMYIDIDAHHGDGVYYPYEADPQVYIFDVHQDPTTLFPGTGFEWERGKGEAEGTKINVALPPGSGGGPLRRAVDKCVSWMDEVSPDYIILQAGMDGVVGDPLTQLDYPLGDYLYAVERILRYAVDRGVGIVMLGGGGYQPELFGTVWGGILIRLYTV